jgi:hypothetical protein
LQSGSGSQSLLIKNLRPARPGLDVGEQSISRASGWVVLTMSHEPVGGGQTSPVTSTDDEGLSSVQGSCWRKNVHEVSKEAETDGAGVEARRVSTSAIPATTFIDLSGVTDAEVVTDIGPSCKKDSAGLDLKED